MSSPKHRSGTRPSSRAPSPTRLGFFPALRSTHSHSSLRGTVTQTTNKASPSTAAMQPAVPVPSWPPHLSSTGTGTSQGDSGLQSSASSVVNVDMSEGMLVRDVTVDAEVDVGDGEVVGNAVGHIEAGFSNEESRKNLREKLKRSLSQMAANDANDPSTEPTLYALDSGGMAVKTDVVEDVDEALDTLPPREYYVLTDAGKPVFTSDTKRSQDDLASAIGLMQAIISVFIDDGDKLRCINAGSTRITFLLRSPLYYVCVSAWREPESVEDAFTSRIPPPPDPERSLRRSTPQDIRKTHELRLEAPTHRGRDVLTLPPRAVGDGPRYEHVLAPLFEARLGAEDEGC